MIIIAYNIWSTIPNSKQNIRIKTEFENQEISMHYALLSKWCSWFGGEWSSHIFDIFKYSTFIATKEFPKFFFLSKQSIFLCYK